MADRQLILPEVRRPDRRLGRHIRHDPQSLRFLVAPRTADVTPRTVFHERRIPLLNQGNLGSCTCSSAVGVLGSAGFWETLPAELQQRLADPRTAQEQAIEWYRAVTRIDPFPGQWEPDDTGSDGLSVAKLLHGLGLIAGYQHITSVAAAHAAIQQRTFFMGTLWFAGMERPNAEGVVTAFGEPLGGHQYQCYGYEAERDLWWFWQTWGYGWGPKQGRFAMTSETFASLLRQQGDATMFVPNTAPAPEPVPVPVEPALELPPSTVAEWAIRTSTGLWRPKRDRDAARRYLDWLGAQQS